MFKSGIARKITVAVALGALLTMSAVGVVYARGKFSTTISVHGGDVAVASVDAGSDISFDVTRSDFDNKDTIWVTNKCFDADGNVVTRVDRAVQWGMWDSLDGVAGPFPTGGDNCVAYTTLRPWQDRIGDAVIYYTP